MGTGSEDKSPRHRVPPRRNSSDQGEGEVQRPPETPRLVLDVGSGGGVS